MMRVYARGFGIFELMLIVALGLLVAFAGLMALRQATQQGQNTFDASTQAREMAQLADAALRYGNTQSTIVAAGASFDASPTLLIAAHQLPANWALRYGAAGTTPLGQSYQARGVKDPTTGAMEMLVWVDGSPRADQVARLSLPAGNAGNIQFASAVNAALRLEQNRTCATLQANNAVAIDPAGSFTMNVSAWATPAPTVTTPAVLNNFASMGTTVQQPPTPPSLATCSVLMPTGATNVCPAGQHSIATWPVCGRHNVYVNMPYPVFGTEAGVVTVGDEERTVDAPYIGCYFGPIAPFCGGVMSPRNHYVDVVVMINNASFHTDQNCYGTSWVYPCPSGGTTMCQVPVTNNTVETYKSNAIENLCCPG